MNELLRDIHRRVYGNSTMLVSFMAPGLTASINFKFHDYEIFRDDNSITISSIKDDELTVRFDEVERVDVSEDMYGNNYHVISKSGWTAEISFI